MTNYICSNKSEHIFNDFGEGFCEVCGAPLILAGEVIDSEITSIARSIGLGMCLIDCTGSTNWGVIEGQTKPSRRDVYARSMADSIMDLAHGEYKLSQPENAYVAIGLFDTRAEIIIFDSIKNMGDRFDSASLRDFILEKGRAFNGRTDISSALQLIKQVGDAACAGDLSQWGGPKGFSLMHQNLPDPEGTRVEVVENFRGVLLTDGAHTEGELIKPDFRMGADPLIGAYWGNPNTRGAKTLASILSNCPIHGTTQLFKMERPEHNLVLRGLFRMASGTGGYCPDCLKQIEFHHQPELLEAYS